jgi:hypothetical protein
MGERLRAAELKAKIVPALLAGTGRMPLHLEGSLLADASVLTALSLAGQALRFERPTAPEVYAAEVPVRDERRILPETQRKPLIWILRSRKTTEEVELALAWSFERLKLRPHPFDLPRLSGFVKAHAEELGPTALHWARQEMTASPPAQDVFSEYEQLNDANWQSAPPSARARYVEECRRKDPSAGLALVQAAWSSEDAEMRLRLLKALQPQLNEGDREFVEGIQKDRGTRVRGLAERALYRLNGFAGEHAALGEILTRIQRKNEGFLHKRTVLYLDVPATLKDHAVNAWMSQTFAEVSCDELARGLKLSVQELIEGAVKDANLLLALALMATADCSLDVLESITKKLPDAWEQMALCGPRSLDAMPESEREKWAQLLARPYGTQPPFSIVAWRWMHRALRGPIPRGLMEAALNSPNWREKLQEVDSSDWAEMLAACSPSETREMLRHRLGAIDPDHTAGALALLDILTAMENNSR